MSQIFPQRSWPELYVVQSPANLWLLFVKRTGPVSVRINEGETVRKMNLDIMDFM